MEERDCGCLHHEGPHWKHMDALWKQKNHELLVQAGKYEESGRASRDRSESMNLYVAFVSVMRLHAQEELARLKEIELHMSHEERVQLAALRANSKQKKEEQCNTI
jgi:hypothetical protein